MAKIDDIIDNEDVEWVLLNKNNPHIVTDDDSNLRCKTCDMDFTNKAGAQTHTSMAHNIKLDGNPSKKKESHEDKEIPVKKDDNIVSDLIMHVNNTDDAKSASKITKDPELMYMFYMMKAKKLIDPDWTLHDFLRESAYFYADQNGISWYFGQDLGIVSDGVRRNAEIVKERWENWVEE